MWASLENQLTQLHKHVQKVCKYLKECMLMSRRKSVWDLLKALLVIFLWLQISQRRDLIVNFLHDCFLSIFRCGECDHPAGPGGRVSFHTPYHDLQGACSLSHTHKQTHISYKYSHTHGTEINTASSSCGGGMWKIVLVSGEWWEERKEGIFAVTWSAMTGGQMDSCLTL